jgi:hypothetical protein
MRQRLRLTQHRPVWSARKPTASQKERSMAEFATGIEEGEARRSMTLNNCNVPCLCREAGV